MAVCRFLELLRESDNEKLRNAFRSIRPSEEEAFEIIDKLYEAGRTGKGDVSSLLARLEAIVPGLPKDRSADDIAFFAEGYLEGVIARRNGVEEEFKLFLVEFGQKRD